jgi:hypothetical protein
MILEPIFFSIKDIPFNPTDKAKAILIFFKCFLLFSHISKLINNNSSNDLTDDKLNDKQVGKVEYDITEFSVNKSLYVTISFIDYATVLFEPLVEGEHKTEVKVAALDSKELLTVVVVDNRGEDVGDDDQD